ncbi:hypothetical protein BH11ARM2_BH11ARM2_21280 [soil metagenome]
MSFPKLPDRFLKMFVKPFTFRLGSPCDTPASLFIVTCNDDIFQNNKAVSDLVLVVGPQATSKGELPKEHILINLSNFIVEIHPVGD